MAERTLRFPLSIRLRNRSFTQVEVSSPSLIEGESDDDDSDMEGDSQLMELLHITNMSLGHKVKDGSRYTVFIESAGTSTVAGNLLPNKIEQCQMDLVFSKEFKVKHTGPTAVHLCGYRAQTLLEQPPLDDDDEEEREIFEYGPAGEEEDDDDDDEEPPQLIPARKVQKVMTASAPADSIRRSSHCQSTMISGQGCAITHCGSVDSNF